ncbi:MAG: N-acetyltransferase [Acidobacteriota bacterium]
MTRVRAETAKDYAAVQEVNKLAFGGEGESRLVEALRKSPRFRPQLSLVALRDQEIVGYILFSPAVIEGAIEKEQEAGENDVPVLVLGPMAVLPEYQRQGIGSQLVRHGLVECKRLGFGIVILVGHPGFYPRFGFMPARAKGLECIYKVSNEAFMVAELVPGALKGVRGMVRYPVEFDAVA